MARIKFFNETTGKWEHADSAYDNSKGSGIDVTGAEVGQIIKVSAVDGNGKPTAWEAVDMPKSAQADWNQNDETAADYVKNRPVWSKVTEVTLAEQTATFTIGTPVATPCDRVFTIGATCGVTWDGVDYTCVVVNGPYGSFIGNPSIMNVGGDTNEPFFMAIENGNLLTFSNSGGEHSFKVVMAVEEIHRLEAKYLPTDAGSNVFTILVEKGTDGELVIDKTYDEIVSARLAGMIPEIRTKETNWDNIFDLDADAVIPYSGTVYALNTWLPNDRRFVFRTYYPTDTGVVLGQIFVEGSGFVYSDAYATNATPCDFELV